LRKHHLLRTILLVLAVLILLFFAFELIFRRHVFQHGLASQMYIQQRFSTAESIWQKALNRDDGDPIPENSLGKLWHRRGDQERAIQHLGDAVKEKPNQASGHYDLGNALYRNEQLDDALEQYKTAMLIDPDDQDAKSNYELVLMRQGYQPPPPPLEGEEEQEEPPQDPQQDYKNTLEALDQKESTDRQADRQNAAPARRGRWW